MPSLALSVVVAILLPLALTRFALFLPQRLLPESIGSIAVEILKDNVKDVRVPLDGVSLEPFLDILSSLA